jgi:mRNA deadenylase 3'-5' endonuclease subunit Ccr4
VKDEEMAKKNYINCFFSSCFVDGSEINISFFHFAFFFDLKGAIWRRRKEKMLICGKFAVMRVDETMNEAKLVRFVTFFSFLNNFSTILHLKEQPTYWKTAWESLERFDNEVSVLSILIRNKAKLSDLWMCFISKSFSKVCGGLNLKVLGKKTWNKSVNKTKKNFFNLEETFLCLLIQLFCFDYEVLENQQKK